MIKSKFILDVLEHSLSYDGFGYFDDGIKYWKLAKPQIEFLTDINYDYTGLGLFVSFSHTYEALNYKSSVEGGPLGGIDIKSSDLESHALTTIFFKDGIIDCLEIWSVAGDYPTRDLENYTFVNLPKNIINNLPPKYGGSFIQDTKLIVKNLFLKIKSLNRYWWKG